MMAKSQKNTTPKSPLELSLDVLKSAKEEIEEYLSGQEFSHLQITVDNGLQRLIDRFSFLAGRDIKTNTPIAFKPVTSFLGEKIAKTTEVVTEDDLDPSEAEKRDYLAKVERLYNEIDTLDVNGILNSYSDAEGETVLRGVAKRVGVDGYDTRELTETFVEDIISSKNEKVAADKEESEIQKQLSELDKQ